MPITYERKGLFNNLLAETDILLSKKEIEEINYELNTADNVDRITGVRLNELMVKNDASNEIISNLFEALKNNNSLQHVGFDNCYLGDDQINKLCICIEGKSILSIQLQNNHIENIEPILKVLANTRLITLDVSNNPLSDASIEKIKKFQKPKGGRFNIRYGQGQVHNNNTAIKQAAKNIATQEYFPHAATMPDDELATILYSRNAEKGYSLKLFTPDQLSNFRKDKISALTNNMDIFANLIESNKLKIEDVRKFYTNVITIESPEKIQAILFPTAIKIYAKGHASFTNLQAVDNLDILKHLISDEALNQYDLSHRTFSNLADIMTILPETDIKKLISNDKYYDESYDTMVEKVCNINDKPTLDKLFGEQSFYQQLSDAKKLVLSTEKQPIVKINPEFTNEILAQLSGIIKKNVKNPTKSCDDTVLSEMARSLTIMSKKKTAATQKDTKLIELYKNSLSRLLKEPGLQTYSVAKSIIETFEKLLIGATKEISDLFRKASKQALSENEIIQQPKNSLLKKLNIFRR